MLAFGCPLLLLRSRGWQIQLPCEKQARKAILRPLLGLKSFACR